MNDLDNEIQKNSDNWKWGVIYFNAKDKRTIVPKRNPSFGFTINFRSTYSWILITGIIAIVLLIAIYPKIL